MTLVAGFFVRGRFSPEVEGTESGLRTKIINWLKARTNQAEAKGIKESQFFSRRFLTEKNKRLLRISDLFHVHSAPKILAAKILLEKHIFLKAKET